MPFNPKRNSRDDTSKQRRSNSESFRSKGGHKSNRTDRDYEDRRGSSYKKEEKSPFDRFMKKDGKPSSERDDRRFGDRDDRRPSERSGDRDNRRPFGNDRRSSDRQGDRDGRRPFGGDDRRSSGRYGDQDNRRSSGRDDKRSSERYGDRDGRKSFGGDDRRSPGKYGDQDNKRSFGKDDKRSSERYGDRDGRKSFGGDDRRSPSKYGDRDRSKSFGRDDRRGAGKQYDRGSKPEYGRDKHEHSESDNDFKYGGRRKFSPAKSPASRQAEDDGLIRLNRYISNAGVCSRRKADELIEAGVVSVNGVVVTELGTKVDPAKDEIRYNNERLRREKMVYVLLNKPKDYITTTDDPQERKTVMQLVAKATKERIYPVGRLDRNTTGLLLLTNDGSLAEKLSHPRNSISKLYHVELDKNLTQGDFNKIEFGITLEDGVIKPDDISYIQGGSKREIGIQIHSGKNRIVRRIFESLGYEVVKLDRVVYANLTKKDLPRGRWRYLEERELIQLKHLMK